MLQCSSAFRAGHLEPGQRSWSGPASRARSCDHSAGKRFVRCSVSDYRKWEDPFVGENGTTCYADPMRNKALRVKAKGAPAIVNGTTPPRRVANAALRPREYLTADE